MQTCNACGGRRLNTVDDPCPQCRGLGVVLRNPERCEHCKGRGKLIERVNSMDTVVTCASCTGRGQTLAEPLSHTFKHETGDPAYHPIRVPTPILREALDDIIAGPRLDECDASRLSLYGLVGGLVTALHQTTRNPAETQVWLDELLGAEGDLLFADDGIWQEVDGQGARIVQYRFPKHQKRWTGGDNR